jgi:hypothetical protein
MKAAAARSEEWRLQRTERVGTGGTPASPADLKSQIDANRDLSTSLAFD